MLPEKDVFLFDFNRNYASILYPFRVIGRFSSKVANFNSPHLHMIQFEFHRDLWHQKLESHGLSCGIICMLIIRIAVWIQLKDPSFVGRISPCACPVFAVLPSLVCS